MAIEFECPECEKTIRVKDSAAGKTGRCPKCRVLLLIPDPADWEDEEEEDDDGQSREGYAPRDNAPEDEPPPPDSPREMPPTVEFNVTGERHNPSATIPPAPEPVPSGGSAAEETAAAEVHFSEAPPTEESDSDTVVAHPSGILNQKDGSDTDAIAPTEEFKAPWSSEPTPSALPEESSSAAALARVRSGRSRRQPMTTARRITIVAAVCAMVLLIGVGWWLYASTLPDLSRTITGERLPKATFERVTVSIPGTVSSDVVDDVLADIGGGGYPFNSSLMQVDLYPASGELEVAVEPTAETVAVRVPLASDPDVREALRDVKDVIAEAQSQERAAALAAYFKDYVALMESGSRIDSLLDYRDQIALNAAVGPVGYAIEAIVPRRAPLLCVYQDAAGNCYFFIPKGIEKFRIKGRKLLGAEEAAPLPVDFVVMVKEGEESVEVSRTPEKEKASEKESEDAKANKKGEAKTDDQAGEKAEAGGEMGGAMSEGDEGKAMMKKKDGSSDGAMEKAGE